MDKKPNRTRKQKKYHREKMKEYRKDTHYRDKEKVWYWKEKLASSEAKIKHLHERDTIFAKQIAKLQGQLDRGKDKLAESEQNIQKAYEQGVKDAIVDSRNEYEPKIKELEADKAYWIRAYKLVKSGKT